MSKVDKVFGEIIKSRLKDLGYTEYQIAEMISSKSGTPLSPSYFSQLLNGNNWYLEYAQQALKILGLAIVMDGEAIYLQTQEELDRIKHDLELAKDIEAAIKRHLPDKIIPKKKNRHRKAQAK